MANGQTPLTGLTRGLQTGLQLGRQREQDTLAIEERDFRRQEQDEDKQVQQEARDLDLNAKIAADKNFPIKARIKATNSIFTFRNKRLASPEDQIELIDEAGFEGVEDAINRFGVAAKTLRASDLPLAKQKELLEDAINEQDFKRAFGQKEAISEGVMGQLGEEAPAGTAFQQNAQFLVDKGVVGDMQGAVGLLKGAKDRTLSEEEFIQQGILKATGSGITTPTPELTDALREAFQRIQGGPGDVGGGGPGGGQQITPELAQSYLQEAGGDKVKARELAKADGYTF